MEEITSHVGDKEMKKMRQAAKKKKDIDEKPAIVRELTSRSVKKLVEVPSPATLKQESFYL